VMSLSSRAHAGCGSFELSCEYEPIISNCGAPADESSDWYVVARSTAAHTTLSIEDLSSSRLVRAQSNGQGRDLFWLTGPRTVKHECSDQDNALNVKVAHDGYRERFGLLHKRRFSLRKDGLELEGEDQLLGASDSEGTNASSAHFAIRFHLHPRVRADFARNTNAVILTTSNGQTWRFTADGADLDVEESLFFADPICLRRSLQIVLKGPCVKNASVVWKFERAPQLRTQKLEVQSRAVDRS